MPRLKISIAVGSAIQAAKAAGASNRDIAQQVKDSFGIQLDQRTIGRYGNKVARKRITTGTKPASKPSKRKGKAPMAELPALEATAKKLQDLVLTQDMPPRDLAALSSELRQTYEAIRRAKVWGIPEDKARNEDADWMVAKLRRIVSKTPEPEAEKQDDDSDGAEPSGTDGG